MFHIGQKVVCVSDDPDPHGRPMVVVKGEVYTVAEVFDWCGSVGVTLVEVSPGVAPGWYANRFRPVVEKSTAAGMAILKEILERETVRDPVQATS